MKVEFYDKFVRDEPNHRILLIQKLSIKGSANGLAQFQAKECTDIPEEVYEKILIEIKKERITNLETLTTKKIRQYLKKIKCNKYYDHSAYILYQINGCEPPSISKQLEEKLRLMFKEIQGPFMLVCPRRVRKNFLNYSYVLHKFVELLGLDEYNDGG